MGFQSQSSAYSFRRCYIVAKRVECCTKIVKCLRVVRPDCKNLLIKLDCVLVAANSREETAKIVQCRCVARSQCYCPVVSVSSLVETFQFLLYSSQVVVRLW